MRRYLPILRTAWLGLGIVLASVAAAQVTEEERARAYFTDLELQNQNGETVRFFSDVLRDRVVLINFMFANCEDACPLQTKNLVQASNLLGDALMGDKVWFVSISIDPERDTPADLKEFAQRNEVNEKGWVFLTGPKENVDHIVKKLGQYSDEVQAHSTLMIAGNIRTAHWMKIPPNVQVPAIVERLRQLAREG